MANFRGLWWKLRKRVVSVKFLLFLILAVFIYHQFLDEQALSSTGNLAKVPHHRKKAKKAKKAKKLAKKLAKQENYEKIEELVENNEKENQNRIDGEIANYSDDDIADGNVFNQEIFEQENHEELKDFKNMIENEIEQANEEPDLKPNQFEKSSDLAMEDFNDEESSGGLILDDKGVVGGDKIEHQIEQQLEEELASTTTEFDTTTIPSETTTTSSTTTTTSTSISSWPTTATTATSNFIIDDAKRENVPEQIPAKDNSEKLEKIDYEDKGKTDSEPIEIVGADLAVEPVELTVEAPNTVVEAIDTVVEALDNVVEAPNTVVDKPENVAEKFEVEATEIKTPEDVPQQIPNKDNSQKLENVDYGDKGEEETLTSSSTTSSTTTNDAKAEVLPEILTEAVKIEVTESPEEASFLSRTRYLGDNYPILVPIVKINGGKPLIPIPIHRTEGVNEYEPYDFNLGTPTEPESAQKREKVRDMMIHAWNGYAKNSFGETEVNPITGEPKNSDLFGSAPTGLTIIDGIGTLYLMGLKAEFLAAREWIENEFKFDATNIPVEISFFEVNIRHLGGLLSIYQLTGDILFLQKAESVAQILEFAFDRTLEQKRGLPYGKINLQEAYITFSDYTAGCFILAEFGTITLEWATLAAETGERRYLDYVLKVNNLLRKMEPPLSGAYSNLYRGGSLISCSKKASFGALGDSFYEYILKFYLLTGKNDEKQLNWLKQVTSGLKNSLVFHQETEKFAIMMTELDAQGNPTQKMGHLACFAGGFWGLTSQVLPEESAGDMELAKGITRTCRDSYTMTKTGIGPEYFNSIGNPIEKNSYYSLRPETAESYFYLWRLTKDEKYRDWAWEFIQAIELHCKADYGYAGLRDVNTGEKNDVQESYFLAETLKYLYLIFSEDDLISLDEFVFNTEAHPLRINPKIWEMISESHN